MKVQKFVQIPDPGYPSHRQLSEYKVLLSAAVISLGGMAMAADEAPAVKGKIRAGPAASAPARPAAPVAVPDPKPQIAGGIRAEPQPPKPVPPRVAGEVRGEPQPPPKPAK